MSLAACGAPTPTPEASTQPPSPVPTATAPTSSLIGLSGGPVLAVKIDHTPNSYPRVGIASADVIYVEPVEAGLTRLLAIFSKTMPGRVGPVRSARESDIHLLANYGKVAFAFSGASNYTVAKVRQGAQVNVIFDESRAGYVLDSKRRAPYHVIGLPSQLLARAGGSVPPGDVGFRYGPAPTGGAAAKGVSTQWQSSRLAAAYNGSGGYAITSDGRSEIDALTGAAVKPANIIVQTVTQTMSANRDVNGEPTPLVNVLGTGSVTVLRDGQTWSGTWSRGGATDPMTLTASDGQAITLAQGQTWVLLVPQGQAALVS